MDELGYPVARTRGDKSSATIAELEYRVSFFRSTQVPLRFVQDLQSTFGIRTVKLLDVLARAPLEPAQLNASSEKGKHH